MLLLELEDCAEAVTDAAGVVLVHGDFEHPDKMTMALARFQERLHRRGVPASAPHAPEQSPRTSGGGSWSQESADGVPYGGGGGMLVSGGSSAAPPASGSNLRWRLRAMSSSMAFTCMLAPRSGVERRQIQRGV